MVSDMSSTTATSPYRLVRSRNSTDATRFLPLNRRFARLYHLHSIYEHLSSFSLYSRRNLRSGECRLALLHECLAALFVVIACKTGLHEVVALLEIALAFVGERLTDNVFDRIDCQRRIRCNRIGIFLDVALQLLIGQHAIDETHHLRLGSGELTRGEEDFLGEGRPHQVNELLQSVKP